jgi:hypothetical protein
VGDNQTRGSVPEPVHARQPERNHTRSEAPRLPALRFTSDGAENIPDPICRPITSDTPCQYVTVCVFLPGSSSSMSDDGVSGRRLCVEDLRAVFWDSELRERRKGAASGDEPRGICEGAGGDSLVPAGIYCAYVRCSEVCSVRGTGKHVIKTRI